MGKRLFAFVVTSALFVGALAAPSVATSHEFIPELAEAAASDVELEVVFLAPNAPDQYFFAVDDLDGGQFVEFEVTLEGVTALRVGGTGDVWSSIAADHSATVQEEAVVVSLKNGSDPILPGYRTLGVRWWTVGGDGGASFRIVLVEPNGDSDTDGLHDYLDADPFADSESFTNERLGGDPATAGLVISGSPAITPNGPDGVQVFSSTASEISFDCEPQRTLSFDAGTTATVECGSITVAVAQGQVSWETDDGKTVTVNAGGSATETVEGEASTIEVGGSVIVDDPNDDADEDGDGVLGPDDLCDGTTSDVGEFMLLPNRYALDEFGAFVDGKGDESIYTLADTGGCSATQIIEEMGLGRGHSKFGISASVLDAWIASS